MTRHDHLEWIDADPLQELNRLKLERLTGGRELVDLSMINPDIEPPRHLIDKLLEASFKAQNHRYAVSRGVRRLREAFAEKYRTRFGVSADPESEICAVMGTKEGLAHTFATITDPGDTVLFGAPTYPLYQSAARLARLEAEFFPVSADEDAMLARIAEVVTATRIKLIVLNFPNNPTGVAVSRDFYSKLHRIIADRNIFVLNDFVYGEMCYQPGDSVSLLSAPEFRRGGAAESYSMSKAYGVPGWRVGAMIGDAAMIRRLARLKSHVDYGIFLPIQHAAASGLSCTDDLVGPTVARYQRRARTLCNGLRSMGWDPQPSRGGVCVWSRLPDGIRSVSSFDVAKRLLNDAGVLATPGILYGAAYDRYLRFALVTTEEKLHTVIAAIKTAGVVAERASADPAIAAPTAESRTGAL